MTKNYQVPQNFIVKLWKKGYHWSDISKFWEWGLGEEIVPNRNLEKRIGIIKSLAVFSDNSRGTCSDLVVILKQISHDGPKINIDGCITDPSGGDNSKSALSTRNYIKKLVNFFLEQENIEPQKLEITIILPRGSENTGKEKETGHATLGKSFGSAIYLALLSAYHQKPISNKVAATGWLTTKRKEGIIKQGIGNANNQEIFFEPGANLAIGGLKAKVEAANKEGVNQLVLSKYNCSPNNNLLIKKTDNLSGFLSFFGEFNEDYQQEVSSEIKEKMIVHWTGNCHELRNLIFQNKLI